MDFSTEPSFGKSSDTGPYDSKESRGFNVLPSEVYSSAWMSADDKPQWVYVDLGSKKRFNELRLHWIHKAKNGSVEISDDAENWKKVADLPQTDSLTYSFKAVGNAVMSVFRWKALMRAAIRIGARWKSLDLRRKKIPNLNGDFNVLPLSPGAERLSPPMNMTSSWLPAVVPGTVLYSYIAAGAVPDPGIADNNLQISESYFNSDFWYRWTPSSVAGLVEATKASGRRAAFPIL